MSMGVQLSLRDPAFSSLGYTQKWIVGSCCNSVFHLFRNCHAAFHSILHSHQRFHSSHILLSLYYTQPINNLTVKWLQNKPDTLQPNLAKMRLDSRQLPATNPSQGTADAEENNPILHCRRVCQATTGGPTTWRGCPEPRGDPQDPGSPQARPGLHRPGHLVTPSSSGTHSLPIASIVSDYTEKLCQSFLCLREGHLSFAFLNLKTS